VTRLRAGNFGIVVRTLPPITDIGLAFEDETR